MVQKTIIDTPHKEGKSQRVITERGGCSRSAVSKHINAKLTWRKQQGWPQAWEYCQAKPTNTWESFTRSELKLESVHQESPRSDIFRKRVTKHFWNRNIVRSILPGLRRKRTGLLLSGPKFSFQMKVNFAFYLEIKVPESGGREERHRIHVAWCPVWSFHSQWWFRLPCHLLVLVHCVFWSPQSTQHLPGHFRALHASFCWQTLWRCRFNFPAGLITCPHCQRYQKLVQWPWCYCAWLARKLTWPEPHREYKGYCQERHQTQQCKWPEGRYQSNLGFQNTWAVPQADCLHATPQWCSNSCKRRPNQVLSA